ncbi:ATP-dependent DNA/RNA helicase DHX36 isoform X6 [Drosophila mojavensis]|nr:ATP-dependent DNA/RNA helicase DHX36 isoform X6 [Drosophila mojavensis]XP_032584619.1 ATP-dependent DNA/RNA helicase DHX36 isoform X6 [Drosophila mojavensis]
MSFRNINIIYRDCHFVYKKIKMHRGNKSQGRSGKNCSRPPGLKGRDIGMYYRNLSRQRKNSDTKYELKINLSCDVSVPPGVIERINEYMDQFKVAREAGNKHLDEDFQQKFHHMLSMNFDGFIEETKKQNQDLNLQNRSLDAHLLDKQNELFQNVDFRARYEDRMKLPTMGHAAEIIDAVDKNQVLLIVGSTGCGKTTQVPQLLLDDCIAKGIGSTCRIVCTQPRRISAITVAERVSYERVEPIGHSVGYQIRLESRKPRERASITYCTTGVLLQQLQSDPLLRSVSVLLLDEIHERSIETDLLMALLKIILPHRPTLKVILMSATVREEDFCNYFNRCPMFRIEGVMHPVEVFYLEDVLAMTGYQFDCRSNKRSRPWLDQSDHRIMIEPYIRQVRDRYDTKVLEQLRVPHSEGCEDIEFIASLIYYICNNKSDGAILVFVPGFSKISQLHNTLKNPRSPLGQRWRNHLLIFPLHSMLPSVEQQSVFRPAPKGKRKVIISTIIAETSVTIDDVVYVINTGRTKVTDYDIETNIQSLEECWVTHANTQQRKGRAGRVQPGVCYNLFSRAREALMSEVPTPEILRCKLEAIILSLKVLHIDDPYALFQTMIDPPVQRTVSTAINLLKRSA